MNMQYPRFHPITAFNVIGRLLGFILLPLMLVLAGCSSDDEGTSLEESELQLYKSAQTTLRSGNYTIAIERLRTLESRFPFGRYAEQAQLEIIYAYYKSYQPEEARAAADRFIRLHPQHPNVDYAYYLKGLASFEEDQNFLEKILPLDPSKRDPGAARDSFNDFSVLIQKFPQSQYAPDAQQRMIYLRNLLAAYEVNVGQYYIKREAFIAAANRGRYVFENFQGTPAVADALAVMVEAYLRLNMEEQANNTLKVLVTNYPNHGSLNPDKSFNLKPNAKRSGKLWLNILTFGLWG